MTIKIISLLFVLVIFGSCSSNEIDIKEIEEQVHLVLNNWHKNAKDSNFDSYFNHISDTGVYIGTDAVENWTKEEFKSFSKPYFEKKQAWSFTTTKRNIYFSKNKNTVWFDELLDTWMGTCRGSGVLEKEKNIWQIKHYVLSITIPNNKMQKVIQVKKDKDL